MRVPYLLCFFTDVMLWKWNDKSQRTDKSLTAKVLWNFARTGFVQTERQREQTGEHCSNTFASFQMHEVLVIFVPAEERVFPSFKVQMT